MSLANSLRIIQPGVIVLFLCAGLVSGETPAQSVDNLSIPSLEKIQAQWKSYLAEFGEVVGTVDFQMRTGKSLAALKIAQKDQITFRVFDDGYQYENVYMQKLEKGFEDVVRTYGANKNYSFSLTQRGSQATELSEVNADLSEAELFSKSEAASVVKEYVEGPFGTTIPEVSLFTLFNHESFELINIEPSENKSLLIRFDCSVESSPFGLSGPVELEIQNSGYYLPMKFSLFTNDSYYEGTMECRVEYTGALGLPRQKSYVSLMDLKLKDNPREKYFTEDNYSFQWQELTNADRQLLYLPAYGFPEPIIATSRYWWILTGGVMFLAGVYYFIAKRES